MMMNTCLAFHRPLGPRKKERRKAEDKRFLNEKKIPRFARDSKISYSSLLTDQNLGSLTRNEMMLPIWPFFSLRGI